MVYRPHSPIPFPHPTPGGHTFRTNSDAPRPAGQTPPVRFADSPLGEGADGAMLCPVAPIQSERPCRRSNRPASPRPAHPAASKPAQRGRPVKGLGWRFYKSPSPARAFVIYYPALDRPGGQHPTMEVGSVVNRPHSPIPLHPHLPGNAPPSAQPNQPRRPFTPPSLTARVHIPDRRTFRANSGAPRPTGPTPPVSLRLTAPSGRGPMVRCPTLPR